jgi:ribosomal protein L40E
MKKRQDIPKKVGILNLRPKNNYFNFKNMINNKEEAKICPYCAEKIKIEAVKCKHCGSYIEQGHNNGKKIKANQHSSYAKFTLVALIFPLVGLILGIAYLTKESELDKKLGEHTLVISILFSMLWWAVIIFFNGMAFLEIYG